MKGGQFIAQDEQFVIGPAAIDQAFPDIGEIEREDRLIDHESDEPDIGRPLDAVHESKAALDLLERLGVPAKVQKRHGAHAMHLRGFANI